MAIDIDIAHVARLARLALDHDELEIYRAQLGVILEHAAQVQAVAADEFSPIAHPLGLVNSFRPDTVVPSLDRDEVLASAPSHENGYFAVPPVLDAS